MFLNFAAGLELLILGWSILATDLVDLEESVMRASSIKFLRLYVIWVGSLFKVAISFPRLLGNIEQFLDPSLNLNCKYKTLVDIAFELTWVQALLKELGMAT
ncbi:hypothetical protein E3N88_38274 [Mikania micrantha]|uniref:Uncharacterized protein n=1 Tax=Mikania micrantha TaxID=192012 RepID=A0A5N6LTL6_9ASTR|nr:hypothetical protein E3N88_38274 [Mikania micrantha]